MNAPKSFSRFRKLLSRAFGREYVPPEEEAYRRLASLGYRPSSIIDVGAHEGHWTRIVRRVFPDVPVLMFEPQQGKQPRLLNLVAQMPGTRFECALLGREAGQAVTFFEAETASSMYPERSNLRAKEVQLTTAVLDDFTGDLPAPHFLKIDVQGAELDVLEGGRETLSRADVVQLEVALLPYNEGAPEILDVLTYMNERAFVPFDIASTIRPTGLELAQVDMLFVPADSPLRRRRFHFPQLEEGDS